MKITALLCVFLFTASASAQTYRVAIQPQAGVAIPTGNMADYISPGPHVGGAVKIETPNNFAMTAFAAYVRLGADASDFGVVADGAYLSAWFYGASPALYVYRGKSYNPFVNVIVGGINNSSVIEISGGKVSTSQQYFVAGGGVGLEVLSGRIGYEMSARYLVIFDAEDADPGVGNSKVFEMIAGLNIYF